MPDKATLPPGRELDRLVAEAMGLIEGIDFGNLGQHNWECNEYSEYNHYICTRCGQSSKAWADEDKLPPEGCYKDPPRYTKGTFWVMEMWEWLEENHPWIGHLPVLGRYNYDGPGGPASKKAVMIINQHYDGIYRWFAGKTYAHAIALAVVEAARAKGG